MNDDIDLSSEQVQFLASLVGLSIDPLFLAGVKEHLERIMSAAALVADFPLPDEVESPLVFRP